MASEVDIVATTNQQYTRLMQELKDFKERAMSDISEIKEHTSRINGRVAENLRKVEIVKIKQDDCPARAYFVTGTTKKDWTMVVVSLLTGLLSAGIVTAITLVVK